jgi:lipid-A-disaccharide synthase
MKVYLVAGEPSGDRLGAELMAELKNCAPFDLDYSGVGGPLMEDQGLTSLFSIDDIAVIGIGEILAKYSFLKERIKNTVDDILRLKPDVLITIDAPEFSLRIARMVRKKLFVNTIHYVAPTVWAWRPKRAKKMSNYIDHILALFPFEPPYMERAGISCDFVGHPIADEKLPDQRLVNKFRKQHKINENDTLVALLPGSRKSEVDRLMPIFNTVSSNLMSQRSNIKIVIVVAPPVKKALKETLQKWGSNIILVTNDGLSNSEFQKLKRIVFASCDIALAASGTVSLELAATGTPMVIAYDMGFLSRIVFRLLIRVNSVNLVNLISNQIIIPEFIGNNCKPDKISQALLKELDNPSMQKTAMQRSVDLLRAGEMSSGATAANSVLDFLQAHENL